MQNATFTNEKTKEICSFEMNYRSNATNCILDNIIWQLLGIIKIDSLINSSLCLTSQLAKANKNVFTF